MNLAQAVPTSVAQGLDPRRWKALILLCTANFMVILDAQIVIMGLPSISADLKLSPVEGQWALSANLLTFGGLLLLGGRAADLLGRRKVFAIGTALFLAVSLLSGLAWNGEVLLIARSLHGVSAALMAPTALSILTNTFPEGRERNKAFAAWSGIASIGATVGLLLGGTLIDWLGWQSIFFVNVPVALIMLILTPVLLRESKDAGKQRTFDVAGAVVSTGALGLLVYILVEAPTKGWLSFHTIGLAAVFVVLVALTVVIEKRSKAPLVPLRLFKSPALVGGNLVTGITAMLAFGMSVVISQYSLGVLKYTALEFGLTQAAMPVAAVAGAYIAQAVLARVGIRPVAVTGVVLLGLGCLLLTGISPDGSYWGDVFPGLILFGLGLGGGPVALAAAALGGIAKRDAGIASGFNTAAFQVGGAIGVGVVSTIIASHMAQAATNPGAVMDGFSQGLVACVIFAAVGLVLALVLLRKPKGGLQVVPEQRTPSAH
ncbi:MULTISPECIES: MFS transporter [unclassified Amycolatopsis]|uniref:MFS transporter n=1 Tax=unclassified Amycolatopsis TaxID=2618356 RepID=UPI002E1E3842|nr:MULTISPECIES: MFS transporter [unclassified Amycolatopsis]